jgi:hypothetical protein
LETIFQLKNPLERTKNDFIKPFSKYADQQTTTKEHSPEDKKSPGKYVGNVASSSLTLCTTKHDVHAEIFEKNNKKSE